MYDDLLTELTRAQTSYQNMHLFNIIKQIKGIELSTEDKMREQQALYYFINLYKQNYIIEDVHIIEELYSIQVPSVLEKHIKGDEI